jgi:hypothetical protein
MVEQYGYGYRFSQISNHYSQENQRIDGNSFGAKIQIIAYRNRIELIPIKPIAQMRGFLKGISTEVNREGDLVELESISEFS